METSIATGRRPKQIYGRARRPCARCGGRIMTRGQGDDNRMTYWCPAGSLTLPGQPFTLPDDD